MPAAPAQAPAAPIAPAPLKPVSKKETAKVPPSTAGVKPLPQATVHLQKAPDPSKSVSAPAKITVNPASSIQPAATEAESPAIAIAVAALAIIALGIQLWTML
jgi:hypothetical protein